MKAPPKTSQDWCNVIILFLTLDYRDPLVIFVNSDGSHNEETIHRIPNYRLKTKRNLHYSFHVAADARYKGTKSAKSSSFSSAQM